MKTRYITFQQCDNDDNLYIVDKLVNCVSPKAGSVHTEKAVERFCHARDIKVTVNRAKT